ncbi:unnamed protein product [Oppiella nova]|uniref:Uncharacterized protein n=1 Tax=Oppiella nova TaxID=334625 RepID=A0A7R9QEF8_9ACAR|nr:unnamed protein product [Oppiella nova]CAG2164157.1 unnamed protein product [Oppiella nova]
MNNNLWITLAERHIQTRQINWSITSRFCFNEKENPDDEALGVQIVKYKAASSTIFTVRVVVFSVVKNPKTKHFSNKYFWHMLVGTNF